MLKKTYLPFLPGLSFPLRQPMDSFHKPHQFGYVNNVPMLLGNNKPGIGGKPLSGQQSRPTQSVWSSIREPHGPSWVAFDKQVLCFDAYFLESVHEMRNENHRVRKCKIYFHLEDDSIKVVEPKVKNSGIPQGTLIRRHKIPLPLPNDDQFYTVEHLNVGEEVSFYGHTFKITDCDYFTRNFLCTLGIQVPESEAVPADTYTEYRKRCDESLQPLRPYERIDTLGKFLEHDRHVLRFWCYWDDRENMFGDVRELLLHYFLADDTIEIREILSPNSGRDTIPVFIQRAKLPKDLIPIGNPGANSERTVLNVFGPTGYGNRFILDSLKTGVVDIECYKDSDLILGAAINAWGRKIVLCDCDDFTKEYYRVKYGISEFSPIHYKEPRHDGTQQMIPPYNGFGSEEDSLANCLTLIPNPPRRDFTKFMEKDRKGLESHVLRFMACLDTSHAVNKERQFMISYFLSDDTIMIYEIHKQNSGIRGGKFLGQQRVKKPGQPPFSEKLSECYTAQDLYVGALLNINNFTFILLNADEYTFRYMEQNQAEFPQANTREIITKITSVVKTRFRDIMAYFIENDPKDTGIVSYHYFRTMLCQMMGDQLTEHERLTLARHYSADQPEAELSYEMVKSIVQTNLRKYNFENFDKLEQCFQYHDPARTGYIGRKLARATCKSFPLNLSDDLLDAIMSKIETSENDKIKYDEILQLMNWRNSPVPITAPIAIRFDTTWFKKQPYESVYLVNYKNFMKNWQPQ